MAKRSKSYRAVAEHVDFDRLYSPAEAMALLKETARASFDETVEVAFRLGVDVRHADQMVRGSVVLPNGIGKPVKVLVFAVGEAMKAAETAGADYVGGEELAEKIQRGWFDFDVAIAHPETMRFVGKLGRVLGPRGLMPNPKSGTVTVDLATAVRDAKAGRVEFRTDRTGIVHAPFGKVSFSVEALVENFQALLDAVLKARPAAAKGQYVRSITVSTTMGPGIRIHPQAAAAA